MKKSFTKTFATKEHLLAWFKTFEKDLSYCYEVGKTGEHKVRFALKNN
ncbi:MAG: hypothetical protein ACPGII_10370 [Opitutales bacterium]